MEVISVTTGFFIQYKTMDQSAIFWSLCVASWDHPSC